MGTADKTNSTLSQTPKLKSKFRDHPGVIGPGRYPLCFFLSGGEGAIGSIGSIMGVQLIQLFLF